MAGFGQYPLQKAIFQVLNADVPLLALVGGLYDRPPQGAAFPYVSFGRWEGQDWSSATTRGMAVTVVL
ncbi:MAG: DUF3168 domain-containing protein, partial [Rickettsiales bacterium]|nr:DUF3168 domain-containing protein [Rickettsiales bacterium]